MLTVESGLTSETITARGYRTVSGTMGAEALAELGFNVAQARTAQRGDVLVVPLYDAAGAVVSHQIRPDSPRVSKGSQLKYETPAGAGNRVDIPPAGRGGVLDGVSPLWVTEGAKTADAIAQTGAATLMLAGVWGFMGRTAQNIGTSVVADLFTVPVQGRTVYLAYDSDVVTKDGVAAAERRLAEILGTRGASVLVVRIPGGPGGAKVGADDYLAAGGTLEELVATAAPAAADDPLGGKSPHVYAYDLARQGHDVALDTAGCFLLRPTDERGLPAGPARRYTRNELADRTLALAGARGAVTLALPVVAHAMARLAGDHIDARAALAPARIVITGEATWVDMGTDIGSDVVRIGADGWGYVPWHLVPHWVVRDPTVTALGVPAAPEARSWAPLWELLGCDIAAAAVVRVWLVALLVADRVPLLWWRGAPGSGKSTLARLLCQLLGLPELVPAPRDLQDAMSKLAGSPWIMAENLGKLAPAISDVWCAALTDGTVSDRVLYTTAQSRVSNRWTGQATSITDVPGALDDLMSRSLTVDVDAPARRRTTAALLADLDAIAPQVLGALFDDAVTVRAALARGLAPDDGDYRFPAVTAIATVLDASTGGTLYQTEVGAAGTMAVDDRSDEDPWVQWLAVEVARRGGSWDTTAGEILEVQRRTRSGIAGDWRHDEQAWPGSDKQVGWWLALRAGRLRTAGVVWRRGRRVDSVRRHTLTMIDRPRPGVSAVVPEPSGGTAEKRQPQNRRSTPTSAVSSLSAKEEEVNSLKGESGGPRGSTRSEAPIESLPPQTDGKTGRTAEPSADQAKRAAVTPRKINEDRLHRQDRQGVPVPCPLDEASDGLLDCIRAEGGALTVDVETSGYPVGHQHYVLRTVQLGGSQAAWVFDVRDGEGAEPVRTLVRNFLAIAPRLHAHSATADLVPLAHAGLIDADAAWLKMHDTVIPAKLADPASTGSDPGLKALAGAVLGSDAVAPGADAARAELFTANKWITNTKATTAPQRSGWAQVDPADPVMLRYAASDVLDTAALAARLPVLPSELIERERAVQRLTARVTHAGLRIDGEHAARLRARHTEARAVAGERVRAFDIENPGSGPQVAAALAQLGVTLPTTVTGRPSVAEGALTPLRQSEGQIGELVAAVLDYREHSTAIGTFLEPYAALCEHGDGRARPTVYTLAADTGRMSCVRPNLQQVPRSGGFRACITADPGQLLVSADFAGVELRVAAALSGDPNLRQMLAQGVDIHWEIARQVYGPDATKSDRYNVKRGVFGRLYGGGIPTLARQVGISEAEAASMVDTLDAMTPGLAAWSRQLRHDVKAGRTHFMTYSGRAIWLPADYPHKAPNYCIQGTARELLIDALLKWSTTQWGGTVLLPVHDEIVAFVAQDEATEATSTLVASMQTELFGVAIKAEASAPSFAWADAA